MHRQFDDPIALMLSREQRRERVAVAVIIGAVIVLAAGVGYWPALRTIIWGLM